MTDQKKHIEQSNSPEEIEALKGAENAAENAEKNPAAATVPAGQARPAESEDSESKE